MSHKVIVPIGPFHPLQEEPEFFQLYVEGEKVVDIDIIIGYNHRGIEKLAEAKHLQLFASFAQPHSRRVIKSFGSHIHIIF